VRRLLIDSSIDVSVVIPTYNCANLLPQALNSVRAQNWNKLEIIVVDDGSSDETADVLSRLSGSDLRSVWQPNKGPAAARNRGISAARGRWIAFLDADDLWLPDKLAAQFAIINADRSVRFCFSNFIFSDTDGRQSEQNCGNANATPLEHLLYGNALATPTVIVRRDCFAQTGGFDTELRTGEDWDMWLRLALQFGATWIPKPLAAVRRAPPGKYAVDMIEHATFRVLDRFFAAPGLPQRHPRLFARRRRIYAWHYAVMAKSYLRHQQLGKSCGLAARAISSHMCGLTFLGPTGLFTITRRIRAEQ
jgi:glycosyltransferase involved in cell wall biosynthesis